MGFGNRLKDILKSKGITIRELSEMTGISINTLYSITKRDTQLPSRDIISKIVEVLEIEETDLVSYELAKQEIHDAIDNLKTLETDFRKKLIDITEMLNAEALSELLNQAIDMLQHDSYRSVFYKKKEPENT